MFNIFKLLRSEKKVNEKSNRGKYVKLNDQGSSDDEYVSVSEDFPNNEVVVSENKGKQFRSKIPLPIKPARNMPKQRKSFLLDKKDTNCEKSKTILSDAAQLDQRRVRAR